MHRLILQFDIQDNDSVSRALEESAHLQHRRMIVYSSVGRVLNSEKFNWLDIIEKSKIENLSLVWLPYALQNTILSSLSNITTLYVDSRIIPERNQIVVDFPNLKNVDVTGSQFFLKCIGRNRIENLKISFLSIDESEFFERANYLKDLTVYGFSKSHDREYNNFQLETLRIVAFDGELFWLHEADWHLESARKFLNSQRRSLKQLYFAYGTFFAKCEEIVVYALNNMDLRKLHAYYSIENGIIQKLNENMKSLKIELRQSPITENLIASCPMVEKIDLLFAPLIFTYILPLLSKHMQFLKHLKLFIYNPEPIDEIDAKFKNVETLTATLSSENDIGHFIKVIKCCPNVRKLEISLPTEFQWDLRDLPTFLAFIPKVEKIYCTEHFGLTEDVAQVIADFSFVLKLQHLKVTVDSPRGNSHLSKIFKGTKIKLTMLKSTSNY